MPKSLVITLGEILNTGITEPEGMKCNIAIFPFLPNQMYFNNKARITEMGQKDSKEEDF